jgi:xanthine dehydrogenase accessory factor
MRQLLEFVLSELRSGRPVVGAVIVSSSGSTPRSTGCRMAVARDGTARGTVGGGPAEALAHKEALAVHASQEATLLQLDLTGKQAAEAGMICGGRQEILLEHLPASQDNIDLFQNLLHAWESGRSSVLCTAFAHEGRSSSILSRTLEPASLPAELPETLRQEVVKRAASTRLPLARSEGKITVLVEPIRSPGTVFVAGAGHVGQATAALCAFAGFTAVVLDDREDFLTRERLPQAGRLHLVQGFEGCFQGLEVNPDGFIVILTRGHVHDRTVLAQALQTPAGYIGMIGSTRKRDAIYRSLQEDGVSQAELDRVHCPIGLSIGADTPEEIAVSIVAELIHARAKAP